VVKWLLILSSLLFFLNSCEKSTPLSKYQSSNDLVFIDVVEKKIFKTNSFQSIYSDKIEKGLDKWFDNNLKTEGFDGVLEIRLLNLKSEEIAINNSVEIKVFIEIEFSIFKSVLNGKKIIVISGDEYGQLNGYFTINDKLTEVDNIIKRLIEKLSIELTKELT